MKKTARVHRPSRPVRYDDFEISDRRGVIREYGPIAFGGVMLVMAFAFAGHYMGQSAIAHNAVPSEGLEAVVSPSSNIVAKGSLLPEGTSYDIVNRTAALANAPLVSTGKGDIVEIEGSAKTEQQASHERLLFVLARYAKKYQRSKSDPGQIPLIESGCGQR